MRRAGRRIAEVMGVGADQEEAGHVRRLPFGRLPVDRVLLRVGNPNRRNRLAAEQRLEVEQPLLAEQPDVQVDAIEGAERADRVGAVLQDPRRPGRVRLLEELRECVLRRQEVVELPVV